MGAPAGAVSVPLCIQLCAEEDEFVDHEEEQEFDEYDDEEMAKYAEFTADFE